MQPLNRQTEPLLQFLDRSPTPFHAVEQCVQQLQPAGYRLLCESDAWGLTTPGKYMITRNDSSLVAFALHQPPPAHGFRLVGAHTDSPCLRVKPNAVTTGNRYARLAVEVYGGALLNPWFDRDLSLAGRVSGRTAAGAIDHWLVDFDRPLAFIPSLAIHLQRQVNDHHRINQQLHLPAIFCRMDDTAPDFNALLKAQVNRQHGAAAIEEVLSFELSLYDHQPAAVVGLECEFIASARLDNLLSCFAGTRALIDSGGPANCVLVLNDHEEVGSASPSGADGTLLQSVLERICGDSENLRRALSRSMLISADNAHGVHPNYPEKHEPDHRPLLNAGPVIKINHNQRYATNSETAALFQQVCARNELDYQTMVVRSDMGCGSTIGPITAARLGVRTVDIGVPQLGMHSIRELAGVHDQPTLAAALGGFFRFSPWPF